MAERKKKRKHADDLRGAARLATHATKEVTSIVERMHRTIGGGPAILGAPLEGLVRLFTAPVYASIRAVTQVVGTGVEAALARLAPALGEGAPGPEREAVVAALNGVLGDHLAETQNPLATTMHLRKSGEPLDLDSLGESIPGAPSGVGVFVHGSSTDDGAWRRGVDFAGALDAHGVCAVSLVYNSGLHVSTNGRAFAELLDRLHAAWPTRIERLVLVTHSMGGLVARSACHYGREHAWRRVLDAIVFLGTPHHGAPLERGGAWLQLLIGVSRYSAPLAVLGKLRSAGVTDLRYGYLLDEDWEGRDRFAPTRDRRAPLPLPDGVRCFAIAGSTSAPHARLVRGDGLVPIDSALGVHEDPRLDLAIPASRRWIVHRTGHIALLEREEIVAKIVEWLAIA